jgi:galactonate dehydratase
MKIVEIDTHIVHVSRERSWLFVEVKTDHGIVGLGEASQSRNDQGVRAEVERLKPQYIGENPLDLIERRLAPLSWPYNGRTLFAAVSALDQALWDLCGKYLKVPLYQLFGGRLRDRVRTYANIGYASRGNTPEALAEAAGKAVEDGFDAIKLYPFGVRPASGSDAVAERRWIAEGVERVRAVREAVGADVDVLVDLMHQFADMTEALKVSRLFEPYDLFWIEDPFVRDDPATLSEFRHKIGPRLAGGAPHLTRHEFRPLLEANALDVVMPDPKWCGGITEVRKAAALAETYGALVSPHNASGPVSTAANVHVALSLGNFLILEFAWGAPQWRSQLSRGTEVIDRGHVPVPSTPGLGIDLDAVVAAVHRDQPGSEAERLGVSLPSH